MAMCATILVVDDEIAIARLVQLKLELDGMRVLIASGGGDALAILAAAPVDLVVLDIMMPEIDGFEVLRRLRTFSNVPVIMLTARTLDGDKLRGLALGADDYLTKPFNPDELSARVQVVLRRARGPVHAADTRLTYGALVIDLEQRRIIRAGAEVRLSRTEWQLLTALTHDAGKVLVSRHLLAAVWGLEFADEVQYLHTWVSRLRRKLGNDLPLHTITGVGYQLDMPAPHPDNTISPAAFPVEP